MKSIKKFFMLGVLAAMTAFCLAPGFALADEGGVDNPISQSSFTDGEYKIEQSGTYNLIEDVTGAINVRVDAGDDVQINLNGHTLTNTDSTKNALFVYNRVSNKLTVDGKDSTTGKCGAIFQDVSYAKDAENKKAAVRFDTNKGTRYFLQNLEVKTQNTECLDLQKSYATLTNVDMSTLGEANSLIYNTGLTVTINGGTFNKSDSAHAMFEIDLESDPKSDIEVKAGTFNAFPEGVTLGDSVTLYKEANGDYKAISTDDVPAHCWKVTLDNQDKIVFSSKTKDIYFKLESEARAFAGDKYEVAEHGEVADLSSATVTLKSDSYAYDGTEKKPEATVVLDGKTLTEGSDYKLSYKSNVEVGTATAVIEGVNDYKGSVEKSFAITKADVSAAKVTLSKTAFTYNGKAQKPSVKSVVLNGKTLKAGTDYTASVASGKKVGTYNVTVTAKGGNYSGKATTSFTVNPKGVTKLKVSKAKKSFKAKWKKAKAQRSGVQVKYSTKKSMANAKIVKAKGAAAKAKTVKKLKKKTKYYVQARTYKVVNGKTYYSGWSVKKAVKTK